jgi:hypothetical protein
MWMADGKGGPGSGAMRATNAASAAGYVLAAELRACGVDLSFTPVLDLDHGPKQQRDRRPRLCRDPRVVSLLAKSLMHGLLRAGMANCGKHFPGHGFVKADSHTDIPVDRRSLKAILADDAAPYGWLNTTLTSVMPAHVAAPGTGSRRGCWAVGQQHHQAVDADAAAAGRRHAVFQRADEVGVVVHGLFVAGCPWLATWAWKRAAWSSASFSSESRCRTRGR